LSEFLPEEISLSLVTKQAAIAGSITVVIVAVMSAAVLLTNPAILPYLTGTTTHAPRPTHTASTSGATP
jgi:hypothetical protein